MSHFVSNEDVLEKADVEDIEANGLQIAFIRWAMFAAWMTKGHMGSWLKEQKNLVGHYFATKTPSRVFLGTGRLS